ncbi:aminotransferase class V-fold PLP-dependent enzyme, partial [Rhodovulum adriaticum]|uniref:aminotransferase class V-fold PLP-dependent enzyme n=1 Tax=Rhodovulum adriaticum TaxID=35804 RepID=UPI0019089C21
IDYIEEITYDKIIDIEKKLVNYCLDKMKELDYVRVFYPSQNAKGSSIAFTVEGIHPHDVSQILDFCGVDIRVGHHCAQPLHRYLKVNSTCRASFAVYNTYEDIDKLILGLEKVRETFYGNKSNL